MVVDDFPKSGTEHKENIDLLDDGATFMTRGEVDKLRGKKLICAPSVSYKTQDNTFTHMKTKWITIQFNIPFNIHDYASYPPIVNMVVFLHKYSCVAMIQT